MTASLAETINALDKVRYEAHAAVSHVVQGWAGEGAFQGIDRVFWQMVGYYYGVDQDDTELAEYVGRQVYFYHNYAFGREMRLNLSFPRLEKGGTNGIREEVRVR